MAQRRRDCQSAYHGAGSQAQGRPKGGGPIPGRSHTVPEPAAEVHEGHLAGCDAPPEATTRPGGHAERAWSSRPPAEAAGRVSTYALARSPLKEQALKGGPDAEQMMKGRCDEQAEAGQDAASPRRDPDG